MSHRPIPDPMIEWLAANGISHKRLVMWPKIEIDDGWIRVEEILHDDNGIVLLLRRPATVMVSFPLQIEPDPKMWKAWTHTQPDARRWHELDLTLKNTNVTTVTHEQGNRLVFVFSGRGNTPGEAGQMAEQIRNALPGFHVTVVTGVTALIQAKEDLPS